MTRKRSSAKPKKVKIRTRFSIGEWYGEGFESISAEQRVSLAKREITVNGLTGSPCRFTGKTCNKKGGVCSIQLYVSEGDGPTSLRETPVCVCPNRFSEDRSAVNWVAEVLLGTDSPIVLGEIGFLDRFKALDKGDDEEDERDYIGRIDNVLIHPTETPIKWCPLEFQAVYFSGKSMNREFTAIGSSDGSTMFPAAQRRPDWRSSGPKRLLPQLQTKVPTIRTWGKKMAVVVDRPFFAQLVGLERQQHLSNSEIIWFVMDYEKTETGWRMVRGEVVMTTLETSVKALTGGTPLSQEEFEQQLFTKLAKVNPGHKLGS